MNHLERFKFVKNVHEYKPAKAFIALIENGLKTKEDLFFELKKKLLFPEYFGFNWDALDECLRDFHWIKSKKIALIHINIPDIGRVNLETYFEILNDAIIDWQHYEEHDLEVVFPQDIKENLSTIIRK